MKGFIITASLFTIILLCVFVNQNYVNNVHNEMQAMLAEFTDEPCENNELLIKELQNYWESRAALLSLSVSFREIDNLSNAIDSLYASNKMRDAVQFGIYKELTQNTIDAIARLEKLSIKNIL